MTRQNILAFIAAWQDAKGSVLAAACCADDLTDELETGYRGTNYRDASRDIITTIDEQIERLQEELRDKR